MSDSIFEEEIRAMVPVSLLYFAGAKNMSGETTSRIPDPLFLDGIRLDFAGLCNQILSADGLFVDELEVLKGQGCFSGNLGEAGKDHSNASL